MKFQKIDQKQVPQVVILTILTVGFLGWGGYQYLGGANSSAHADTNTPPPSHTKVADSKIPATGQTAPVQPGQSGQPGQPGAEPGLTGQPGAALPGAGPAGAGQPNVGLGAPGFNPDPFRSPAKVEPVKPVVKAPPVEHHATERWPGNPGELPNAGGPGVAPGPTPPVVPVAPTRPTLTVTGIIDVQGGSDMALVEQGSQQRIVQVGDQVDQYKIKKIDLGGITLVNGKDKYYAGLASTEKADGKG